jgi:large subunit ribosomal protein L20
MTRTTQSNAKLRRKKFLKLAKGFYGRASTSQTVAKERVYKALVYARTLRIKKPSRSRVFHIKTLNYALALLKSKYSTFMNNLNHSAIQLNVPMLATLSKYEPKSFLAIYSLLKQ